MKTSARFLAMLLAVIMIASAALSVTAFDDVNTGSKYADAINVLAQLGIVGGYEDGTFKPDQKVTRAEMAKLAYVLYTTFIDAGDNKADFADVKEDHWATGYISWCSGMNIIGGYGDGNFGPDANVTYDQALKMVCGVLGYTKWDSKLWPTDVRVKALNELNLGENLEDVNGSDELTRGQVAQVIYNALDEKMYQEPKSNTDLGLGIFAPQESVRTLGTDVWKFVEYTDFVTATENYAIAGDSATGEEDEIKVGGARYALEDLGLTEYEGKTDNLIGLTVTTVTRDEKLLATAIVSGKVTDEVTLSVSDDKKTITIDGVAFDADDELDVWTYDDTNKKVFESDAFGSDEKAVSTITSAIQNAYLVRTVDTDADGVIDAFAIFNKTAFVAGTEVKEGDVTYVRYETLDGETTGRFAVEDMTATVKEGDVFVATKVVGKIYVEVIESVETYAEKYNEAGKKVTLNTVGAVKYGTPAILGADGIELSDIGISGSTIKLGSEYPYLYYIYNGEILKVAAKEAEKAAYNFAILSYFNEPEDRVFNTTTMTFTDVYTAMVIIDGKQVKVPVAEENAVDALTALEATEEYKKILSGGDSGYVTPYNLLVTYTIDEDGKYSFKTRDTSNEDYLILEEGATIKYDANSGLYVISNGDGIVTKKAIVDKISTLYYTYVKETTGDHQYIGTYTVDTIPEVFDSTETESVMYYTTDEETGISTIVSVVVQEIIVEEDDDDTADYRTDGRLLLYCYKAPQLELNVEKKKTFYTHYLYTTNTFSAKSIIDEDLNKTETRFFYAYDELNNNFIKLTADNLEENGIECISTGKITDIINSSMFTASGEYRDGIKLPSATKFITFTNAEGTSYKELTLTELKDMLKLAKNRSKAGLDAIFFTYMDEDDKVISTIVVEYVTEKNNYRSVYEYFAGNVDFVEEDTEEDEEETLE